MALTQRTTPAHPYRRKLFATASLAVALLTASSALALHFEVPATPVAHAENTRAPQVSAREMAGRKKSGATPEYPAEAREKKIEGKVTLALTINAEGEPEDIRAVESPSPLLTDSAIKAVQTWRWEPYELDGKPVPVDTTVNVTYSLAG